MRRESRSAGATTGRGPRFASIRIADEAFMKTTTTTVRLRPLGIPMLLIGAGIALACALPPANAAIVVGGVLLVIVLDMTGVFDNRAVLRAATRLGAAPRRRTADVIDLASARRARMRAHQRRRTSDASPRGGRTCTSSSS